MEQEPEKLRLTMDPEPPAHELVPIKRIRYVFTVVMSRTPLPDDPVAQRVWIDNVLTKLDEHLKPERVGVIAVMEDGDVVATTPSR